MLRRYKHKSCSDEDAMQRCDRYLIYYFFYISPQEKKSSGVRSGDRGEYSLPSKFCTVLLLPQLDMYGSLLHHLGNLRKYLVETFGIKIICYGGYIEWPLNSPDLVPLYFLSIYNSKEHLPSSLFNNIAEYRITVLSDMLRNSAKRN